MQRTDSPTFTNDLTSDLTSVKKIEIQSTEEIHFVASKVLGEGAEGRVLKAYSDQYGNIALKAFEDYSSQRSANFGDEFVTPLKKEYLLLKQLEGNENILQAYDFIEKGTVEITDEPTLSKDLSNRQMMTLQFCPAGDMFDLCTEHKEMLQANKEVMKNLFVQVCKGVHQLHSKTGYAHLDIKPDNMLIGTDFKIKLCDLGLAKSLDAPQNQSWGTEDYQAPEVREIGLGGYSTLKADLFALGVSLFVLNFALPPWKKAKMNSDRLFTRFHTDRSYFLRSHPGLKVLKEHQLDTELFDLISLLCAVDPNDRPNSVEQVIQHPYLKDSSSEASTQQAIKVLKENLDL